MQADIQDKQAPRDEEQKRQTVFAKRPTTILVKVLAMSPIKGVSQKQRDDDMVELKHRTQASARGLDAFAYREGRADTGYCLFQKQENVRVKGLLADLTAAGYKLVNMHWQQQNNKGPVTTFEFALEGDAIALPPKAEEILGRRFNHCTVWCNLRYGQNDTQFRLDTINIAKGVVTDEAGRELRAEGNTYRLK